MSNRRQDIHVALLALCAAIAPADCRVRDNAETPNDWDAEDMKDVRNVLIVRHGGFTRPKVITGKTDWIHAPTIEGHTRADSDAELAEPSNALLDLVTTNLADDLTLGGICEGLSFDMDDDPEPNVSVLEAGSMLTWRLRLAVHVEEITQS